MSVPHPAHGRPQRILLEGRYARLEPIAEGHMHGLFRAAEADRYRWLFENKPENESEMRAWTERSAASADPLVFAVIDRASGEVGGRQSLMRITPEHGTIEIGGILWGNRIARSRIATEALFLFAQYAFETLGYRRFEWKCNDLNEPSKRAAVRFGFAYEGTFRQHMIIKGQNRDTAWFAMLDGDWPRLKAGYKRWLDPGNFTRDGMQKSKLAFD